MQCTHPEKKKPFNNNNWNPTKCNRFLYLMFDQEKKEFGVVFHRITHRCVLNELALLL